MSKDIDEMEKMLNDYLQFAKTQTQENTIEIKLKDLLNELINDFNNENLNNYLHEDINFKGRPSALKRSFENIVQNGLTYGNKVFIKCSAKR